MIEEKPRSATLIEGSLTSACGAIHFIRQSTGPPLIFLHGMGTTLASFGGTVSRFHEKYQTISIDLLGHGGSDLEAPDLSVTAQAEAVLQLIRDFQLQNVSLIGHSLGGSVALLVAALAAERVRKIVLLAAGVYEQRFPLAWRICRRGPLWNLLGLLPSTRLWALRQLARRLHRDRRLRERLVEASAARSRTGWVALGRAYRQSTTDVALARLEAILEMGLLHPTLVLWGSDDRFVHIGAARVLFREKKNSRFIEVAGGSHMLHEEHADLVGDLILEFLE